MKIVRIDLADDECQLIIGNSLEVAYALQVVTFELELHHGRMQRYVLVRTAREMAQAAYNRGLTDGRADLAHVRRILEN